MPIDGLVSGLDTDAIVSQLMELERVPRNQMANRRDVASAALEALRTIDAKLGSVSLAASALARPTGWTARVATSTDSTVATATANLGAAPTQLTFRVDALAAAHGIAAGGTVPTMGDVVAPSGSITLTIGGEAHVVDVGGGTLEEVIAAVNAAGLPVRAVAVNTGNGHRLQIDSTTTGAASAFTLDGLDPSLGGTVVTTEGADARITLGTGPGAYSVTSSTNAFTDITPGVSVVARAVSASPVTISVAADDAAIADRVSALVDAANAALEEITKQSAYDPETKRSALLTGDAGVRRISQTIIRAVTEAVGQSALGAPSLAGISLDRSGKFTFDRSKFLDAYASDPAAVERLFVAGGTSSADGLSFSGASGTTASGTAAVEITALPTAATISSDPMTWPADGGTTLSVRRSGNVVSYELAPGDTIDDAVAGLQAAIDEAGLGLVVTHDGSSLTVTSSVEGSSGSFDVAWDGATWYAALGTDIEGTIDGVPATGSGRTLTAGTGSPFAGLAVTYDGIDLGAVGSVSYEPGLAQRLVAAVAQARVPQGGALTSSTSMRQARIDTLTRSIEAYDRRLVGREAQLRAQYAALEVALGKLQSMGTWLSGQLAGLMSGQSR